MATIELRRVSKVFYPARQLNDWLKSPFRHPRPKTALVNVSLTIEEGSVLCLMGENGAGKTTLLRLLMGLLIPDSGSILMDGLDVTCRIRMLAAKIGFVCGDRAGFYDRLTGRQNLEFFAALHGLQGADRARRVGELIETLDVPSPDRHYQEYSSGMKQRLILARALLHDPDILLLDEPTKGLDPDHRDALLTFIQEELHQRRKKTVVMTTHHRAEVQRVATHSAVIHHEQIQQQDSVQDFTEQGMTK